MYVYIKYIKGCTISLSELQIKYNIRYHSTYTRMIKIKIRANKSFTRSSLKFTSIKSVMPSSHLILCCPILLLPPIPPNLRVFSNESALRMRWPKYWSFSFSVIPSKEHPGSPCSPEDSQESSPTPQFKSINSLALSFLHCPTLTSIHNHRKNHSLD